MTIFTLVKNAGRRFALIIRNVMLKLVLLVWMCWMPIAVLHAGTNIKFQYPRATVVVILDELQKMGYNVIMPDSLKKIFGGMMISVQNADEDELLKRIMKYTTLNLFKKDSTISISLKDDTDDTEDIKNTGTIAGKWILPLGYILFVTALVTYMRMNHAFLSLNLFKDVDKFLQLEKEKQIAREYREASMLVEHSKAIIILFFIAGALLLISGTTSFNDFMGYLSFVNGSSIMGVTLHKYTCARKMYKFFRDQ